MELIDKTIEELMERRTAIAAEIDAPDADLDALEAEARAINEEVENRKAAEIKRNEIRNAVAKGDGETKEKFEEVKKMTNNEIRNSVEYINAYANYIKTGKDDECRSLLSDNVNGGVVPVPDFVGGIVAERVKASRILSRVRRMNAKGNVKVGFEIAAPAAGYHTEGGVAMTEEALELGIVTLIPSTLKKWVSISDEALDSMNGRAYLEYLYDEVTRGIIKARENAVVAAILAAPQTAAPDKPAVAKTGSAVGAITDFVNARALLSSAAENLVIICSPADYATYRGYQMGANYGVDPFDGLEVLFSDAATAPIIGDLSGVMENLPLGDEIQFKYDDKTDMKKDLVNVLGRQPVATAVVGNLFFAKVSA